MKALALTLASVVGVLLSLQPVEGASPVRWRLPKDTDVYLMENDLVYARFLALARGGTYRQINRNEHGSFEVDRGRWEQDAAGALRLHSSCRALRPRALKSGPLYVIITRQEQIDALPGLLTSLRRFLGEYADKVFDAGSAAEWNASADSIVQVEQSKATFDRIDAANFAVRLADACRGERDGTDVLEPVKNAGQALFFLPGGAFSDVDLVAVEKIYGVHAAAAPPFYFARIDTGAYAREVGRWQPLHLPGSME